MHRVQTVIFATLAALGLSTGAFAQAVIQSVVVKVNPGQMDTYLARVATLQGVMDRVGAQGSVRVWGASVAGTESGNTLVAVAFPSLAAFAEGQTKIQADAEWQKVIGGLDGIRTVVSQSLLESRDGGGVPAEVDEGAVLQGVIVRVHPGKLDEYLAAIEKLKAIQGRVGMSGTTRVWQSTLAGPATGNVAVAIVHANLAAYAADSGMLAGDAEAQKLIAGLDDIRTVVSRSLYTAAGP